MLVCESGSEVTSYVTKLVLPVSKVGSKCSGVMVDEVASTGD